MYDKLNIIVPTRSNRAWLVPVAATAKKRPFGATNAVSADGATVSGLGLGPECGALCLGGSATTFGIQDSHTSHTTSPKNLMFSYFLNDSLLF